VHTLADASFEAWLKYYQPDENTPNATISYYVKGALAALCLDLHLRLHTRITLDDVLRELWRRYGSQGRGVPERGLEQVASELSRLDLSPQFDAWLRSTAELPLAELLGEFGVDARLRGALGDADQGGRVSGKAIGASLGLRLRGGEMMVAHVLRDGPAQRAGVSGGDVPVALDGLRLHPSQWTQRQMALVPGRSYTLQFFRGDELLSASIKADPVPLDTWTLTLSENVSPDKLARRKTWLGA
jgi:predicted metalloprotease with PDZ domain